ncbi:MAG TPA: DUF998 domain-containing protein [Methanotrichaceae archaeon]|nr:DUF998 domain-containing protein [Methanotrichaceae archaeon]
MLFIVGVLAFLGIITAEALYPGYSTSQNQISDLGATQPPNSIIMQPSATIFNTTMIISGLLIIATAYYIHLAFRSRDVTVSLALFGLGGLERWIAYPILLWVTGFGGYLMGHPR